MDVINAIGEDDIGINPKVKSVMRSVQLNSNNGLGENKNENDDLTVNEMNSSIQM